MPKLIDQLNKTPQEESTPSTTNITLPENKDLQYAVEQMYSKTNLEMKTDLNSRQIIALARGHMFAGLFGSSMMSQLCETVESLLISKNRKGRTEITDMTKNTHQFEMQQAPMQSVKSHLLGM